MAKLCSVKQQGFTLIEVMIAMAIASTAIIALLKAISQTSNNIIFFQEKTLASIVASNLAIETRLSKRPALGYKDDEYKMANTTWQYRKHTVKTLNKDITKTTISVFKDKENKKTPNAELLIYLEKRNNRALSNSTKTVTN